MAAAAVAVVACLATAATAAVVAATRDDGVDRRAGDGPSTVLSAPGDTVLPAFADGQTVYGDRGDNAAFGVPSGADDWELSANLDSVSWTGEDGLIALLGPALYALDDCPEEETQVALGFTGFVVPIDDTGQGADVIGKRVIDGYTDAMAYPDKGAKPGRVEKIDQSAAETADGVDAVLYRTVVRQRSFDQCQAPETEVSVLCFDSGAFYTTVLLGRELTYPEAFDAKERKRYPLMSEETRDRILGSVRLLSPATATSTVEPSESDSGTVEPSESETDRDTGATDGDTGGGSEDAGAGE